MKKYCPIILLASERSGTNLLRAIVSSHSAVASPPPCGIVGILANSSFRYISPLKPPHYGELITDAILTTQTHLNRWDVVLAPEEVRERMRSVSFWSMFQAMNEIYAERKGCKYWFSKEPDLFRHIYEIEMHMPDAKFVYLVRDGRDVAASMLKGGIHEHHIYNAARRWSDNQKYCLSALSDSLMRDRIFVLKYEELVVNPETVGRQLMRFIGLDFEESQLEFHRKKEVVEHSEKSEFWENLAKPIDSFSIGNYKKFLSPREIGIYEGIAWHEMGALGYTLEGQHRRKISTLAKGWFTISAVLRRKLMEMSTKDEYKRHKVRNEAMREITNRFFDK